MFDDGRTVQTTDNNSISSARRATINQLDMANNPAIGHDKQATTCRVVVSVCTRTKVPFFGVSIVHPTCVYCLIFPTQTQFVQRRKDLVSIGSGRGIPTVDVNGIYARILVLNSALIDWCP